MKKNDHLVSSFSLAGVAISLLALLAYLLTISPVFYPGSSSQLVAQHLGHTPFPALTNMVWGSVIHLLSFLPVGTLALRLNIFSAICAAAALYVFFQLVMDLRPGRRRDAGEQRSPEGPLNLLAATVATLYLAACIPFWIVATRAHPLSFDLLLGLMPFRLVQVTSRRRGHAGLYWAAFVYGLSVTEYSTMMALGPLLALYMLIVLMHQGRFTVGVVLGVLASLLAGFSPYLLAAWHYMQTPAYEWREFTHYGLVLKYIWLEQWTILTKSLPRVGWLTMGILTVVPWAISHALHVAPRPRNAGARLGQALIHILMAIILVAVLWDFPFSPWRATHGQPIVLMPYVFAALGMGFIATFLVDLLGNRGRNQPFSRRGYAVGVLLVVISLVVSVRHLPETNGRSAVVVVNQFHKVLDSMGDRKWLLTNGECDAELALLAQERGLNMQFINPRISHIDAYQNYLASLFEEPRLQSLARVGLLSLLKEWLEMPGQVEQVGVMSGPDLWEAVGLQAVPEGLIYTGESVDATRDPTGLITQFMALARGPGQQVLDALKSDTHSPAVGWHNYFSREYSRQANNLGVYVEDQQRPEFAESLYREALRFNTNNISALINLNALARRIKLVDEDALAKELEQAVKLQEGDYTLWSLSQINGYVRSPEVFASRGWSWAMSGKPGMAVREIKRAIRAGGDTPAAQLALAQMYFAQDDDKASEETYRKLLAVNPDHAPALLGLSRLAVRRGDYAEARRGIQRLRQLDVSPNVLNVEEAVIEAMAGDVVKCRKLLQDVLKRQPDDQRALVILALVASQQGDAKQADEAVAKLKGMKNLPPSFRLVLAQLAFSRKDLEGARRLLDDVLRAQPTHVPALILMVRIQQAAGDREQAERYLNRLLSADPSNAYGNFLLGTFQYIREQYALAEASYRASLISQRAPEALNAVAYLTFLRGDLDEAEALVRESIKIDDGSANAWDTLANILIQRGKLPEAEETLQKALALQPGDPGIRSTQVRLYAAQERRQDASKLADELLLKASELSKSNAQQLRDILKRLRDGG